MRPQDQRAASEACLDIPAACKPLMNRLFTQSGGSSWGLTPEQFSTALTRSAQKALAAPSATPDRLEQYFAALHLQDLALASACAEGHNAAWEYFVATCQEYLRSASAAILHCAPASPNARELADSLLADLYGLAAGKRSERSLFRYFHGRSSLKTWLRAVLAQRHVDAIRAGSRLTELPDEQTAALPSRAPLDGPVPVPGDPHRARYLALFSRTLEVALGLLDPRDKERLRLYYAEEQTLAEIGRRLGEHESSVSRNLDRVRRQLRHDVEEVLRQGHGGTNGLSAEPGLSEAQLSLCLEYAAEDAPIDFNKLFPAAADLHQKTGSRKP